jgi:hypothetical protein
MFGNMGQSLWEKPEWRINLILWYHRKAGDAGYVPCPLCLISGARVRVRLCTNACGHVKESQAMTLEQYPDAEFTSDDS